MDRPADDQDLLAQALKRLDESGEAAVEGLLAQYPEQAGPIRRRLAALGAMGMLRRTDADDGEIPERLGEYFIKRRIGRGGMGVVYLAEQPSLGRDVALKLIRPEHLYFPNARERFQREIEAIARLQHPAIVRVYSAGVENGVPYFTMEHVEGVSLDRLLSMLDRAALHRLTEVDVRRALHALGGPDPENSRSQVDGDARLRRWIELCLQWLHDLTEAIEYAHDQGVLHRDIKPSNVMISWSLRAMLLDFGLATTSDGHSITRTGAQLGSVPYMAPEQVRGDIHAIDARTDVYALGVLLYELLALTNPFHDHGSDESATRERIVTAAPLSVRRVNSGVSRDAETVCRCAMAPEPDQRYQSAATLAADLQNLLHLRPVNARRPTAGVRVQRFVRRHRALATGLLVALVFLVVAPTALAVREFTLRQEVQAEADTRAEILDFFREELLGAATQHDAGKDATMREVLDLAGRRIDGRFDDRPLVEAAIRSTIGHTYRTLGDLEAGEEHLERALVLYRAHAGDDDRAMLETERMLGMVWSLQGRLDELEALLRRNHAACVRAFGEDDPHALQAANDLGYALLRRGQYNEAAALLQHALEVRRRRLGERHDSTLNAMNNLGLVYFDLGRYAEAEPWVRRELELCAELHGHDHPSTLVSRHNHANLLGMLGRVDDCAAGFESMIADSRRVRGADHPRTLDSMLAFCKQLLRFGQHERAAKIADAVLANSDRLPANDWRVLEARTHRAAAEASLGPTAAAEAALRAVVRDAEAASDRRATALARRALADLLAATTRSAAANTIYADLVTGWPGEANAKLAELRLAYARSLIAAGQLDAARAQLAQADAFFGATESGSAPQAEIQQLLGELGQPR